MKCSPPFLEPWSMSGLLTSQFLMNLLDLQYGASFSCCHDIGHSSHLVSGMFSLGLESVAVEKYLDNFINVGNDWISLSSINYYLFASSNQTLIIIMLFSNIQHVVRNLCYSMSKVLVRKIILSLINLIIVKRT